jgi:hypothetical protein
MPWTGRCVCVQLARRVFMKHTLRLRCGTNESAASCGWMDVAYVCLLVPHVFFLLTLLHSHNQPLPTPHAAMATPLNRHPRLPIPTHPHPSAVPPSCSNSWLKPRQHVRVPDGRD